MSYDVVQEKVPIFVKRLGDQTFQGSNNVLVIMGTDRAKKGPAKISDGLGHVNAPDGGKGTGTYHVVVGRKTEDPDFDKDDSFIYLSMKTNVDENLGLNSVEKASNKLPAAVVKSDAVRVVYRKDLKIAISDGKNYVYMDKDLVTIKVGSSFMKIQDGKIVVDAGTIELGEGATEKVILGDTFKQIFESHVHPTAVGPSGPPTVPVPPSALSQRKVLVK